MTIARCPRTFTVLASLVMMLSACGGEESPVVGSAAPTTSVVPGVSTTAAAVTTTTVATTTTASGSVVAVTVQGGQVQGPSRQRVERGQSVTVRVTSDVADQIHVHGYDKTAPVAAGGTGEVTFVAAIPGVFEVEFERSGKLLFTLEVRS